MHSNIYQFKLLFQAIAKLLNVAVLCIFLLTFLKSLSFLFLWNFEALLLTRSLKTIENKQSEKRISCCGWTAHSSQTSAICERESWAASDIALCGLEKLSAPSIVINDFSLCVSQIASRRTERPSCARWSTSSTMTTLAMRRRRGTPCEGRLTGKCTTNGSPSRPSCRTMTPVNPSSECNYFWHIWHYIPTVLLCHERTHLWHELTKSELKPSAQCFGITLFWIHRPQNPHYSGKGASVSTALLLHSYSDSDRGAVCG